MIRLISESITSVVEGPRDSPISDLEFSAMVRRPTFSDMPQSFTICVAMEVACFKSELAPRNMDIGTAFIMSVVLPQAKNNTILLAQWRLVF